MKAQTLTIIGMNRLGVSIGLAVKNASLPMTIIGCDNYHNDTQQAEKLGAIDSARRNIIKRHGKRIYWFWPSLFPT